MSRNVYPFEPKTTLLDGSSLTTKQAVELGKFDSKIAIHDTARYNVIQGREVVDKVVKEGKPVYGINTGFGINSNITIPDNQLEQLQENLILSHATGSGQALLLRQSKTMVALRINTLLRGNSGIRLETLERMVNIFNLGLVPEVPSQGSVGASGDLAPLARIAAAYFKGKGRLYNPRSGLYEDAAAVLKRYDIEPNYKFQAKEGLALINGTQFITAVGSHAVEGAKQAMSAAQVISALSLTAIRGHKDAFEDFVWQTRPQRGVKEICQTMLGLITPFVSEYSKDPQDPYSFRCIPPVHGTSKRKIDDAEETINIEINSSTDNPLVLAQDGSIRSAGNFHGQPVADALDSVSQGASTMVNICEQRIKFLLDGQRGLPKYLVENSGLNSGLMTPEIEAAAHTVGSNVTSYSTMSRSTGLGKEDHVSMGAHSARQAYDIVNTHLFPQLTIELAAATQAIRLRMKNEPDFQVPPLLKPIFEQANKLFPHMEKDRYMANDMENLEGFVKTSKLFGLAVKHANVGSTRLVLLSKL